MAIALHPCSDLSSLEQFGTIRQSLSAVKLLSSFVCLCACVCVLPTETKCRRAEVRIGWMAPWQQHFAHKNQCRRQTSQPLHGRTHIQVKVCSVGTGMWGGPLCWKQTECLTLTFSNNILINMQYNTKLKVMWEWPVWKKMHHLRVLCSPPKILGTFSLWSQFQLATYNFIALCIMRRPTKSEEKKNPFPKGHRRSAILVWSNYIMVNLVISKVFIMACRCARP